MSIVTVVMMIIILILTIITVFSSVASISCHHQTLQYCLRYCVRCAGDDACHSLDDGFVSATSPKSARKRLEQSPGNGSSRGESVEVCPGPGPWRRQVVLLWL